MILSSIRNLQALQRTHLRETWHLLRIRLRRCCRADGPMTLPLQARIGPVKDAQQTKMRTGT
jgi:hypothetical protein